MLKHINENEFQSEVLDASGVVVVDFYADWCGPCKMLAPILEELQEELTDIKIVKVNVDENNAIANKYGIASIPTIKIFKAGEDKETKVGFMPKDMLKEAIEEVL
ncbi:MAG: thioredoxin [Clostridium sp.]|uniref:thioredoxin n=1 Tax=Clostridium sp. DSM 8431 TaxID=1761781 RepID=UPI0008E9CD76|nr:thioredoxin [Clostridium sp. DSM 8431]MCR4944558.1 thioredoxin [Clostridium sp.]SFU41008.1 thioredoxin [Clostridium sp. DSM 8431]